MINKKNGTVSYHAASSIYLGKSNQSTFLIGFLKDFLMFRTILGSDQVNSGKNTEIN